jgi:serine/threonine-protein kinase RsbW
MSGETKFTFAAELKNLAAIREFVQAAAIGLRADPDILHDVILAVDESATNIVMHGYRGQPGAVEVEVKPEGDALVVCLRDQAPPFDPTQLPSPDLTLPFDQRPVGGLGVYLTRTLLDEVTYRATPQGGNELTLVKKGILPNAKEQNP